MNIQTRRRVEQIEQRIPGKHGQRVRQWVLEEVLGELPPGRKRFEVADLFDQDLAPLPFDTAEEAQRFMNRIEDQDKRQETSK